MMIARSSKDLVRAKRHRARSARVGLGWLSRSVRHQHRKGNAVQQSAGHTTQYESTQSGMAVPADDHHVCAAISRVAQQGIGRPGRTLRALCVHSLDTVPD
jgi:hypothetical protein